MDIPLIAHTPQFLMLNNKIETFWQNQLQAYGYKCREGATP